jgi:rod shape determining protein RodA
MIAFFAKVVSGDEVLVKKKGPIDWVLFLSTLPIIGAGLVTMNSFTGDSSLFTRQIVYVVLGTAVFFSMSFVDFRFLRRTNVLTWLYAFSCLLLVALFVVGSTFKGAQSWFNLGPISFQPSDPAKVVLILVLAKYFSRRHVQIKHFRHIIVSGIYAFIMFLLVLVQPDFGSAFTIFLLWFGMVLVSGISWKHLMVVGAVGLVTFAGLWSFGLKEYQKQRIKTFLNPVANISTTGYNAYQSMVAVGSGELVGKGLGYGTQSRLKFLPEYQTDFVFAAFAEEWGFVGVLLLLFFYGLLIWRILLNALRGVTNFELLFGVGIAIYLMAHLTINVGMNMGLLPVTGLVAPLMSYGGSHLVTEFFALGVLMGMRRYGRTIHKDVMKNEFLGM